jgi:glycosyltransferase involved in cell wall biosynthesis
MLKMTLESILKLEFDVPAELEIIIIDNNSNDQTKEVVFSFSERFQGRLKYFFQPIPGKSLSLNMGIQNAKGDILAFTDDDVELHPAWLNEMHKCFNEHACDGIGGRVLPSYSEHTPQWVKDNAIRLSGSVVIYDYGEKTMRLTDKMYSFIGANFAFKKDVFLKHGFFRTDLGPGTKMLIGRLFFIIAEKHLCITQ